MAKKAKKAAPKMPDPKKIKQIGILTGGGDCPGLNAVIRGVVRAAVNLHGWEVTGILDGFDGLIKGQTRKITSRDVRGLQARGGTILGTSNRGNPLNYPVEGKNGIVYRDITGKIIANIKKLGIDVLITVGGDGYETSWHFDDPLKRSLIETCY